MKDEHFKQITETVGRTFRTFGGGQGSRSNPVADALKDEPLSFAAGVDVADVVLTVIHEYLLIQKELRQ